MIEEKKKPQIEILSPAGSYESFLAAIHAGADAVYAGGPRFGARAFADNFTEETLKQAIDYAHFHGRKVYLTVNTLLKDREIETLHDYLEPLYLHGLDAVIVQDVGVLELIRHDFPDLEIHASTQMSSVNVKAAQFLQSQGVTRVVPAREISLEEIQEIYRATGMEIECFVHGALCYCYSGQCLLSTQWKQRAVCPAVPSPVQCGSEQQKRIRAQSKRHLYSGFDSGADRGGRLFI